jgi:hypothetical protein
MLPDWTAGAIAAAPFFAPRLLRARRPIPGRCRSGIHKSSTTVPTAIVHNPIETPEATDRHRRET